MHKHLASALVLCAAIVCFNGSARAVEIPSSERLHGIVERAVQSALETFGDQNLKADQLAVTVLDLSDPPRIERGSFRGDEGVFPASVVKTFYLAATHRWLEDGRIKDSDELRRAMKDMIVVSSNDATGWILEVLTGAANGPLLPPQEMEKWSHDRNAVNRWFTSLGYTGINTNQKTYCERPYGRERLFIGPNFENRNKLTTDATARLMAEIASGQSVSPDRSRQMMDLLRRNHTGKGDSQATDYVGAALGEGDRLWSKAGWTSTARHDSAYVETHDGRKFVIVVFTTNHSRNREIIPTITRSVLEQLRAR